MIKLDATYRFTVRNRLLVVPIQYVLQPGFVEVSRYQLCLVDGIQMSLDYQCTDVLEIQLLPVYAHNLT